MAIFVQQRTVDISTAYLFSCDEKGETETLRYSDNKSTVMCLERSEKHFVG